MARVTSRKTSFRDQRIQKIPTMADQASYQGPLGDQRTDSWQKKAGMTTKRPLPEPTSVQHVFLMIIMHICRRIILFETEIKICVYLAALTCGSLVSDFTPVPRSYFSMKGNFLNVYFVKWSWAWTLLTVGTYLYLTSYVYCCGNIERMKGHFYRLLIATCMWITCTKLFVIIEDFTAGCMNTKYHSREPCIRNGFLWKGFDISGHAFILVYCSLIIAEEAKSIRGWERIGDLIRNEEFEEESPLKKLSEDDREHLNLNYSKYTPYVRAAFLNLTLFCILWDMMLVATIMYFHSMVQKVVGGSIAILVWYFTYKFWFLQTDSVSLPGEGCFKYSEEPMKRRMAPFERRM